jgi:hypothetical protein
MNGKLPNSHESQDHFDVFLNSLSPEYRGRVMDVVSANKIPTSDPYFQLLSASGLMESLVTNSVERLSQVANLNHTTTEVAIKQLIAASDTAIASAQSSKKSSQVSFAPGVWKTLLVGLSIGSILTGLSFIPLSIFLTGKLKSDGAASAALMDNILSLTGDNIRPAACKRNLARAGITTSQINKAFPGVESNQTCLIRVK